MSKDAEREKRAAEKQRGCGKKLITNCNLSIFVRKTLPPKIAGATADKAQGIFPLSDNFSEKALL